jgi:hypothetical protein
MPTIHIIAVLLLVTAVLYTLFRTITITRAVALNNFLVDDASGCCDGLGFTGCSVICYEVNDIDQIESLLLTEFYRYEVVAVIDSHLYPDIFHDIVKRYGLVAVNSAVSDELPHHNIRTLYRSRQRRHRRIVLIDEAYTSPCHSLNCATLVASFDYIIPLNASMRMLNRAIESVAILIAENEVRDFAAIRSSADDECYIFKREYIISRKGFTTNLLRNTSNGQIVSTPIPLTYSIQTMQHKLRSIARTASIIILLIGIMWIDGWLILATILSAMLIFMLVKYYTITAIGRFCPERAMLCYFRHIWRIFYGGKFLV